MPHHHRCGTTLIPTNSTQRIRRLKSRASRRWTRLLGSVYCINQSTRFLTLICVKPNPSHTLVRLRPYVVMGQPLYTSIPNTKDKTYWQLKTDDTTHSLQSFVPIYPELQRQLKAEAWKDNQAKLAKKHKPLPPMDVEQSKYVY